MFDREDLALTQVWKNYIALDINKEDLAMFLSDRLNKHNDKDKEKVVGDNKPDG